MLVSDVITRVRRILDQVPGVGEKVSTDTQIVSSYSTVFSDANLIDRINEGIGLIVSNVKAMDLTPLLAAYTSTISSIHTTAERILGSRVERHDGSKFVFCVKRPVATHRRLERSGRTASVAYPVYTNEDSELLIYPTPTSGYVAVIVNRPTRLTLTTNTIPFDERFYAALVYYVASTCYQTMQRPDMASLYMNEFEDEISIFKKEIKLSLLDDENVRTE